MPRPVWASVEKLCSPEARLPVVMSETMSACGSAGSERRLTTGWESVPVMPGVMR